MDDPNCDRAELFNTYRQFSVVNSLIAGWKRIYKSCLKPLMTDSERSYSLLDIGFGGGDIPLKLAEWAANDGIALDITAIETDQRAIEFVQQLSAPENVAFRYVSSTELMAENHRFDFVISNHLLHHLGDEELPRLLDEAKNLSTQKVIFNDIERSDLAYGLFKVLSRPIFRSSFITHDGLASIKRSFTLKELQDQTPEDWEVERLFPFRLLLSYTH